jgi:hypothetical protein
MSQINAIHGIPSYYFKIHFNIILSPMFMSSQSSHYVGDSCMWISVDEMAGVVVVTLLGLL